MQIEAGPQAALVVEDPLEPGPANARLAASWIHVWALIGYLQGNGWDIEEAAQAYRIPKQAVDAAVVYYEQHRQEIEARLEDNARTIAGDEEVVLFPPADADKDGQTGA